MTDQGTGIEDDPLQQDPLAMPKQTSDDNLNTSSILKTSSKKGRKPGKKNKKSVVLKISKGKSSKKKTQNGTSTDNAADDDGNYEVEAIVDDKKVKGRTLYRVRWKGYSQKDDSWLAAADLNCKDILQKYKKKQQKQSKDVYEVERIIDHRPWKGSTWYRLRWVGYRPSEDTWQAKESLSCADLLKEYHENRNQEILNREKEKAKARQDAEKNNNEYEVSGIVDKRVNKKTGKTKYLVSWKGWDESSNTWQDEDDLNCPELIKTFNKKGKSKAQKRKRPADSEDDSDDSDFQGGKRSKTEYEVEKILNCRVNKQGKWEFFVMWKGYSVDDCNWEPESNLNCQALIDQYFGKNKVPKAVRDQLDKISKVTSPAKKKERKPPAVRSLQLQGRKRKTAKVVV